MLSKTTLKVIWVSVEKGKYDGLNFVGYLALGVRKFGGAQTFDQFEALAKDYEKTFPALTDKDKRQDGLQNLVKRHVKEVKKPKDFETTIKKLSDRFQDTISKNAEESQVKSDYAKAFRQAMSQAARPASTGSSANTSSGTSTSSSKRKSASDRAAEAEMNKKLNPNWINPDQKPNREQPEHKAPTREAAEKIYRKGLGEEESARKQYKRHTEHAVDSEQRRKDRAEEISGLSAEDAKLFKKFMERIAKTMRETGANDYSSDKLEEYSLKRTYQTVRRREAEKRKAEQSESKVQRERDDKDAQYRKVNTAHDQAINDQVRQQNQKDSQYRKVNSAHAQAIKERHKETWDKFSQQLKEEDRSSEVSGWSDEDFDLFARQYDKLKQMVEDVGQAEIDQKKLAETAFQRSKKIIAKRNAKAKAAANEAKKHEKTKVERVKDALGKEDRQAYIGGLDPAHKTIFDEETKRIQDHIQAQGLMNVDADEMEEVAVSRTKERIRKLPKPAKSKTGPKGPTNKQQAKAAIKDMDRQERIANLGDEERKYYEAHKKKIEDHLTSKGLTFEDEHHDIALDRAKKDMLLKKKERDKAESDYEKELRKDARAKKKKKDARGRKWDKARDIVSRYTNNDSFIKTLTQLYDLGKAVKEMLPAMLAFGKNLFTTAEGLSKLAWTLVYVEGVIGGIEGASKTEENLGKAPGTATWDEIVTGFGAGATGKLVGGTMDAATGLFGHKTNYKDRITKAMTRWGTGTSDAEADAGAGASGGATTNGASPQREPQENAEVAKMSTSSLGKSFIKEKEGHMNTAYADGGTGMAIGYGFHSVNGKPVQAGDRISDAEMEAEFERRLPPIEAAIKKSVKVPIKQGMFDALVDLGYNMGEGKLAGTSVVKWLNAGNEQEAIKALAQYNTSQGKPHAGLTGRRAEAQQLAQNQWSPRDTPKYKKPSAMGGEVKTPTQMPSEKQDTGAKLYDTSQSVEEKKNQPIVTPPAVVVAPSSTKVNNNNTTVSAPTSARSDESTQRWVNRKNWY